MNLYRVGIGVTALALRCHIKKVVIVRHSPHKWGSSLNDDDGLRRGTSYHQLTPSERMRLTEKRFFASATTDASLY